MKDIAVNLLEGLTDWLKKHGEKQHRDGAITVACGRSDIEIKLNWTPHQVSVMFSEEGAPPVCIGDVDFVGVTIIHDGFLLHANITSPQRHIRWVAERK